MQNKKYTLKWAITYKGKSYVTIYGKKKAYNFFVRASKCLVGLEIVRLEKQEKRNVKNSKANYEYIQRWRAENKEKVKEYNRRHYLKRKKLFQ